MSRINKDPFIQRLQKEGLQDRGSVLIREKKYDQAIKCYDDALKIDPNDQASWYYKGTAYFHIENYIKTIECCNKVTSIVTSGRTFLMLAWHLKGLAFFRLNKDHKAVECCDKALALDPKYLDPWDTKGHAFYRLGKYFQAIECFDQILKKDPTDYSALKEKGYIFLILDDSNTAIQCFNRALAENPYEILLLFYKGCCHLFRNELEPAERLFNQIIEIDKPSSKTMAYQGKGIIAFLRKQSEIARGLFEESQRLETNKVTFSYYSLIQGKIYTRHGLLNDAQEIFSNALYSIPRESYHYTTLQRELEKLQKQASASLSSLPVLPLDLKQINIVNKAAEDTTAAKNLSTAVLKSDSSSPLPKDEAILFREGNNYLHQGNYPQAISCFELALLRNPHNTKVRNAQGFAFFCLGEGKKACDCFDIVIKNEPKNSYALGLKGFTFLMMGDVKSAITIFDSLLVDCSNNGTLLVGRGLALLLLKQEKEADDVFQLAETFLQDSGVPLKLRLYLIQGKILMTHQMKDKAQTIFQNALKLQADYKPLLIEIEKIAPAITAIQERSDRPLDPSMKYRFVVDIAKGLDFLHACKPPIVHRDLKSLNILLDEFFRAKICDFGLSKVKSETRTTSTTGGAIGTPSWMAPELAKRGAEYTPKADIYSFALVIWEIYTRKIPFADAPNPGLILMWVASGEREKIPADCPKKISSLISACWKERPEDRPNASEIVGYLNSSHEEYEAKSPPSVGTYSAGSQISAINNFASQSDSIDLRLIS